MPPRQSPAAGAGGRSDSRSRRYAVRGRRSVQSVPSPGPPRQRRARHADPSPAQIRRPPVLNGWPFHSAVPPPPGTAAQISVRSARKRDDAPPSENVVELRNALRRETELRRAAEEAAARLQEELDAVRRERDNRDEQMIADLRIAIREELESERHSLNLSPSKWGSGSADTKSLDCESNPRSPTLERRRSEFNPSQPLVGLCNPLLDMSLHVDAEFLKRWGLEEDSACLASESTIGIFPEIAADEMIEYIPGGSGLNTLRVAQWILESPGSTVFIGTTGTDAFGEKLHDTTQSEGVAMPRCELPEQPTGTCAVLLTGRNRSLVANLGAGAVFDRKWLRRNLALRAPCESAGIYYVTGFFLRTCPEAVHDLAALARKRSVPFCLNLSAPFVCQGHPELFSAILPDVDLLFGNSSEAQCLAQALSWEETDSEAIARKLQAFTFKQSGKKVSRMVVITQGAGPVIVARNEGVNLYETPAVSADEVVDTNGAGDAFVGGFLAKRLQRGEVEDCVKLGQWAASIVIGRAGCTLPPLPPGVMKKSNEHDDGRLHRRLAARRPTLFPRVLKEKNRLWTKLRGALLGAARFSRAGRRSLQPAEFVELPRQETDELGKTLPVPQTTDQ
eukprot:Hpha_TRINITY_DN15447_c0_g3::TRINITY_DN15447_c0_g3_i1::g.175377::m.175377/K00856/E2.7.1.20, ADK; adenosine kinase